MALDFPANPSDGDVYSGFEYDATFTAWRKLSGVVKMLVSDTKPEGPANGDIWFDSSDGKTYVFYNDGDSSQWIEFAGNIKQGIDGTDGSDAQYVASTTAPSNPTEGMFWFNSETGRSYLYFVDSSSNAQWVEVTANMSGYLNVADINDVVLTSPTTNQVLSYDGTNWVNADAAAGGGGISVTGMVADDFLRYNGTDWAPDAYTDPIKLNGNTISANFDIPTGYNGLTAGPVTIADGVTVTIADGSAWSIV